MVCPASIRATDVEVGHGDPPGELKGSVVAQRFFDGARGPGRVLT